MDQIIRRLETIHRALRNAPESLGCDPRVAEAVAGCLRELHAIAAQTIREDSRRRLRVVEGVAPAKARLH
jgi:chemotaxis regulatin CheY-phosphate phosphatase CheZ